MRAIGAPSSAAAHGIEQVAAGAFLSGTLCPLPSHPAIVAALGTAATATASQIGPTRMTSINARTANSVARASLSGEDARRSIVTIYSAEQTAAT